MLLAQALHAAASAGLVTEGGVGVAAEVATATVAAQWRHCAAALAAAVRRKTCRGADVIPTEGGAGLRESWAWLS